jgi:DNA-binding transcriptional LysR family regulator
MDTERIIEFRVLAVELNFHRAAERLSMSQPTLSRHIEELEHAVGLRLFRRDRHHVVLTDAGQRFLEGVRDLPERLAGAMAEARDEQRASGVPVVRLGYGRLRGFEVAELALSASHRHLTDMEIELVQIGSDQSLRAVESEEIDLALARPPVDRPPLHHALIARELLAAILYAGHPLATADSLTIDEVFAQPFISLPPPTTSSTSESTVDSFSRQDLRPRTIVRTADSVTSMFLLVESGYGIGLAPQAVFRGTSTRGLVMVPLEPPVPGIPLHLVWRGADEDSPANRAVRELILASSRSLGAGYELPDHAPGPVSL